VFGDNLDTADCINATPRIVVSAAIPEITDAATIDGNRRSDPRCRAAASLSLKGRTPSRMTAADRPSFI